MTQPAPPVAVAECRLKDDPRARVYRLIDYGDSREVQWALTLAAEGASRSALELPLARAKVQRTADTLSLSSTSSNGGATVTLDIGPKASRLDVFVNYELEVNVWRDLSPAVESMNTEGPRLTPQVTCVVNPSAR